MAPPRRVHVVDVAPGVVGVLAGMLATGGWEVSGGAPDEHLGLIATRMDLLVVGPLCAPRRVTRLAGEVPTVIVTALPLDERDEVGTGPAAGPVAVVRTGRMAAELVPAVRRALAATADRSR